jgi:hypothetical protein
MKKLILIFILESNVAFAQFGVDIHQSEIPFVGFNYEFSERWRPEVTLALTIILSMFRSNSSQAMTF